MANRNRIVVALDHPFAKVDTRALREFAKRVLSGEGVNGTVNIVLSDDDRLRELNRTFRGVDRTTNVLAFPLSDDLPGENLLGDVYISLERAAREAKRFDESFERRLTRLVAHGVLHLAGYDHRRPAQVELMRRTESRYLEECWTP